MMPNVDAARALERQLVHLRQYRDMGLLAGLKRHLAVTRERFPNAGELDQFDQAADELSRREQEHGVGSALQLDHPGIVELMSFKRTTLTPDMIANARKFLTFQSS